MTARWRTREELIHQVVLLATQGMSRRAITRALGVSRNTIRKILRAHGQAARYRAHGARAAPAVRAAPAKIDAYRGRVDELLVRYPDITAQRVFETLRDEGFTGRIHRRQEARAARAPAAQTDAEPRSARVRARRDGRERLVALRDHVHRSPQGDPPTLRVRPGLLHEGSSSTPSAPSTSSP